MKHEAEVHTSPEKSKMCLNMPADSMWGKSLMFTSCKGLVTPEPQPLARKPPAFPLAAAATLERSTTMTSETPFLVR